MNSILITGGTGKVGKKLVAYFISLGYQVCTTTTKRDNKEALLKEIGQTNGKLEVIITDFAQPNGVGKIIAHYQKKGSAPNVVIHNARSLSSLAIGSNGLSASQDLLSEYEMAVVFPYEMTMALKKIGGLDNVIFISSMYGVVAPSPSLYEDFSASSPIQYGIAKAAQIHLTKELAVRMAPEVRVNCISFGGIQGRVDEGFLDRYARLSPQGRMLTEDDVVEPIAFLVSEGSKSMTGHNLIVDGGWTIW